MDYAKAIRVARSLANVSQAELADRAQVDRSYLSLIEAGKRQPTLKMVERLSSALKLPYHLITLLGIDKQDSKNIEPNEIQRLAEELTRLLLQNHWDGNDKQRTLGFESETTGTAKPSRARVPSRRRSKALA